MLYRRKTGRRDVPKNPQKELKDLQEVPKDPQEVPKDPQEVPKDPQEVPKDPQEELKDLPSPRTGEFTACYSCTNLFLEVACDVDRSLWHIVEESAYTLLSRVVLQSSTSCPPTRLLYSIKKESEPPAISVYVGRRKVDGALCSALSSVPVHNTNAIIEAMEKLHVCPGN